MKIFPQLNKNDCGISVLQSIIHKYQKTLVPRTHIYNSVNITEKGIDIWELERFAKKYDLSLESYWISYEDFMELEEKEYFISLININNLNHYVIIKKKNDHLSIYDSDKGYWEVSYQDFKPFFINVYIKIKKKKILEENAKKDNDNLLKKSFFYPGINVTLIVIAFLLKIFGAICIAINLKINKILIIDSAQTKSLINLAYIIFFSALFYVVWSIGSILDASINLKHKKIVFKSLYAKLFESLNNKKASFYSKMGEDNFLHLNTHINNIASFYIEYIPSLISNSLIIFALTLSLSLIHNYFLIAIFASLFLQIIFCYVIYQIKKKYYPELIDCSTKKSKFFFLLDRFLLNEWNIKKWSHLCSTLKHEINKEIDLDQFINSKNIYFEKMNDVVVNLTNLFLVSLGVVLYSKNLINFDQIIFVGFIFFYLNKYFSQIIEVYLFNPFFQKSLFIYKNWINIDEIGDKNEYINWPKMKFIEIKNLNYFNGEKWVFQGLNLKIENNTFIFGCSGSGKSTLYKLIIGKISLSEKSIFFNNTPQQSINPKELNEKFIYQRGGGYLSSIDWNLLFSSINASETEVVNDVIKSLDINMDAINFDKYSSGQKQALNIISLLALENKVIFLDEAISQINLKNKYLIITKIFPLLRAKNFLVCSEHDLEIKKFFKHNIELSNANNK